MQDSPTEVVKRGRIPVVCFGQPGGVARHDGRHHRAVPRSYLRSGIQVEVGSSAASASPADVGNVFRVRMAGGAYVVKGLLNVELGCCFQPMLALFVQTVERIVLTVVWGFVHVYPSSRV